MNRNLNLKDRGLTVWLESRWPHCRCVVEVGEVKVDKSGATTMANTGAAWPKRSAIQAGRPSLHGFGGRLAALDAVGRNPTRPAVRVATRLGEAKMNQNEAETEGVSG